MFRRGLVTAKVMDTRHHRSPLIQGGFEIPNNNDAVLSSQQGGCDDMMKYEDFVNKWYKEPEDGKFEDATKDF